MPRTALSRRPLAARITSGLLALALASGLTLAIAGPAAAAPTLAVSIVSDSRVSFVSSYTFAQSFVPTVAGDLRTIVVNTNGVTALGDARVVTLVNGLPTGPTRATATPSAVGNTVTFTFAGATRVETGATYAVVFSQGLAFQGAVGGYAAGDGFYSMPPSQGWASYQPYGYDIAMTLTVEPRTASPVASVTAVPQSRAVALTWPAPVAGDTPTAYEVDYRVAGAADWITWSTPTERSATVTGLAPRTAYEFSVRTRVDTAVSARTTTSATPFATATAPLNPALVVGDEQVTVSWDAPADPGTSPITKYVVELVSSAGTVLVDGATSPAVIPNLVNGTAYTARIFAVSDQGDGTKSAALTGTPSAYAEAPVLTVTEGDAALGFEWTAPLSDGSAITQYEVEVSGPGGTTTSTTLPAVREFEATGLTNGASYTSRVRAYNSRGAGAWSATSTSVPRTVPGAPTALEITPGTASAQLSWTAPTSNGGATIDSYAVEYREVGAAAWTTVSALGTATGIELTGLANGVAHEFRLAAVNEAGAGATTAVTTATPFAATFTFTKPDGSSLEGARLPRGTTVVLAGTQLPEGATVSFELHSAPVVLGTGVVAADGTVTIAATIPADAAAGNHALVGTVTSQGVTASASVAVVVPLIVIPTGGGDLAVTGTELLSGLNLAALLVLIGGALLMVARRRSNLV